MEGMSSVPPRGEELLSLLIALELKAAAFYIASAHRFDSRNDLRMLWGELAEDERVHARLLEELRAACDHNVDWPPVNPAAVQATLDDLARHLERLERGELSPAEALAITINLETSELVELSNEFMAAACRRHPTLNLPEWTTVHVNRLIATVNQMNEPELTTILKTLSEKAGRTETRGQRTILIVDDEADMLESCARIIRRGGYHCVTTSNSRDALALLDRERPALLITDLRMPDLDGLKLLREVKRIAPSIPVVVVTAYVSEASSREALEAGAASYLAKPFTALQLQQTVAQALGVGGGGASRS
jgi:CheY-like chemotaxis protein